VKLTAHFHLVLRSKNAWSYTSTLQIRLHGVVLSSAQGKFYLFHLLDVIIFLQNLLIKNDDLETKFSTQRMSWTNSLTQ
jgi:hypothetical protein